MNRATGHLGVIGGAHILLCPILSYDMRLKQRASRGPTGYKQGASKGLVWSDNNTPRARVSDDVIGSSYSSYYVTFNVCLFV